MTPRQSFALFTLTGVDVRELGLSVEDASGYIGLAKNGARESVREALLAKGGIDKRKLPASGANWEDLYSRADKAGKEAANSCQPNPMVVSQHASPFNDSSPVVKQWYVPQGVCGFAWINIRPGNSPFANWLKKRQIADKAYEGGVKVWVSDYGQSMELKEAYARAFAKVLQSAGIKAYSGSRMD